MERSTLPVARLLRLAIHKSAFALEEAGGWAYNGRLHGSGENHLKILGECLMMVKRSLAGLGAFARASMAPARGLACLVALVAVLGLAGCSGGQPAAVLSPTETAAAAPTSTPLPSDTPAPSPTDTPEPSATPTNTPQPPTDTPIPPLAVQENGFDAWCAPLDYAGVQPDGPVAPEYARRLTLQNAEYRVPIPAVYCAIAYRLNQAAPAGLELRVLDGANPFIQQPLDPAQEQANTAWTTLSHQYVVNPPFWEVTYTLVVLDPGGSELWSSPVTFAKPLPEPCPYGGLPDPITLYCAITDPWEIEPWPDVTYPYDRTRVSENGD
jgi:hypothetical protein